MIVHAADLHVGAPLDALGGLLGPETAAYYRRIAAGAFDHFVDTALGLDPRVCVLAGDLFDLADREVAALARVRAGLERLRAGGVAVFVACGNHDPSPDVVRGLGLPPGVVVFDAGPPQEHVVDVGGVAVGIAGVSFASPRETANLARRFVALGSGDVDVRIGVLHTMVAGASGHEAYAPCSVDDLRDAPVHYWALGHVHARRVEPLGPGRWWAYPGNLQGRSTKPAECGPKGFLVVPLGPAAVETPRFVSCDTLRFRRVDVDVSAARSTFDAVALAGQRVRDALVADAPRPVLAKVTFAGARQPGVDLGDEAAVAEAVRIEAALGPELGAVVGCRDRTMPAVDVDLLRRRGDLLAEALGALDGLELPARGLEAAASRAVGDVLRTDPDRVAEIRARAEVLLVERLGGAS